jgi:hypothetical protein
MRALAVAALLLVAASCNEGNDGLLIGGADFAVSPALTDLSVAPDLAQPGKTCGQIVLCAISCGMVNLQCLQNCGTGASLQEIATAGTLVACAVQNCLPRGDAGMGSPTMLATCAFQKCPMQVSACGGLGL